MSQRLISLNRDLKKLRDEGYEIEIKGSHLLVHHIPYATAKKQVAFGVLVTPLGDLAGDHTVPPKDHVIFFIGEHPCDKNGNLLKGIQHASGKRKLAEGIEIDHSFSNKPSNGYTDYHDKVTTYYRIISAEARAIDPSATAKTNKVIDGDDDAECVFHYLDTNSSRAEIEAISSKIKNLKIAIIGVGGTGSYVLDFVAKTPVREIHLFDEDAFYSHNAFRAPGAASIETLREQPKKVGYLHGIYSKVHKHVIPHDHHVDESVVDELSGMSFAFVCIDHGKSKRVIIAKLLEARIPFVDVGIGMHAIEEKLTGSARVTTITPGKSDHVETRISFSDADNDDYDKNVQIAEINALNAAFAVIKWKKMFGFYHDLEHEYHSAYEINVNKIFNDEVLS